MEKRFADFWTPALAKKCGVIKTLGEGLLNPVITSLVYDSRKAVAGSLYFALPGLHTDGAAFIDGAIERGALCVVTEKKSVTTRDGVLYIIVENARDAMPPIASAFYAEPSSALSVIGVTGTEGKSTTVYLIFQLLRLLGKKAGFVSTVQYSAGGEVIDNSEHQTTPEAPVVEERLFEMAEAGCEYAVLEASSHGLSPKTGRLSLINFHAGIVTNVTHEHLEFHGTVEQYRDDKANLARKSKRVFILNADDPSKDYFQRAAFTRCLSVSASGRDATADASVVEGSVVSGKGGNKYKARFTENGASFELAIEDALPGAFNIGNVLQSMLCVSALTGVSVKNIAPLISKLEPVRGRMTSVDAGQDFEVIVDFAHTPSSFEAVFPPIRARLAKNAKIIAVFGSAGERDTKKRPLQGEIAASYSDFLVLTDEDPRGEEPMDILREIAGGVFKKSGAWRENENLFLIPNRKTAIEKAFSLAKKGDVVLLLGKGHENSIIYKDGAVPWDEIEAALKIGIRADF